MTTPTADRTIERLNGYLRNELRAAHTYAQALHKLGDDRELAATLEACLRSHRARAERLREQIEELGGVPCERAGAWAGTERLFETDRAVDPRSALDALEWVEVYNSADYEVGAHAEPSWLRRFVESTLVPEQRRSYGSLWRLRTRLSH